MFPEIKKEALMDYNIFEEFYYSTVCHVCKLKNQTLKTCKNCQSYRYCSVEHQKIHWSTHKSFCKVLHTYLNRKKYVPSENWLQTRMQMKAFLENGLARPLMPAENQVWMFPRACSICKETDFTKLFDCLHCPAVSYCSKQHQLLHKDVHSKVCNAMSLQYKLYCARMKGISDVVLNRNITFQEILKVFCAPSENKTNITFTRMADRLSHVMTIINASTICGILQDNKCSYDDLTIHIVGVTYECSNFSRLICELIFHWIGNLKSLQLVFIGPELADETVPDWEYCSSCQNRNIQVQYCFEPKLYSEYYNSARYKIPNIVTIFNCGFHELNHSEFDLWGESLPLLLVPNVPVILTSYTYTESIQDLERIKNIFHGTCPIDILRQCEKNDFRSPLPLRDWINTDEIYYNNYYFSILMKPFINQK